MNLDSSKLVLMEKLFYYISNSTIMVLVLSLIVSYARNLVSIDVFRNEIWAMYLNYSRSHSMM